MLSLVAGGDERTDESRRRRPWDCHRSCVSTVTVSSMPITPLSTDLWSQIVPLTLGSLALLGSSLANQALPRVVGQVLDGRTNASSLTWLVLGGGLASWLRTTCLARAQAGLLQKLRQRAWQALMTLGSTSDRSPAHVDALLNHDMAQLAKSCTTTLANGLRSTSAVCFSAYHMFLLDPSLLACSASVVPLVGAMAMLLRQSVQKLVRQQQALETDLASFVHERWTHKDVVQLAHRQADEVQHYVDQQRKALQLAHKVALAQGSLMAFLFASSSGALLWVVGRKSTTSPGQLTSFATYSFLLGLGTSGLVKGLSEWMQTGVCVERYVALLEEADVRCHDDDEPPSQSVETIDSLELENVSFEYSEQAVLKGCSLKLERGKIVALVGMNGAGKSTIASLLVGLLQPSQGSILLSDGTPLAAVSQESRKSLVQLVPQSTALFNLSVRENVRYGQPKASDDEILDALKLANCTRLMDKLDHGLDFVVGLNGDKLSGGERQRLALARALLSDPAVLIMDEPTSSLDAEGEGAIRDAMDVCRSQGKAFLLITHQAASLESADVIHVLKDGTIVESGTLSALRSDPSSELCSLMPDVRI